MGDVSVIGTGAMGGALVEVLTASETEVTVWNRTKEKAETLSALSIPAYPSEVRSGARVFFVSGDRAAYEAHRERFEGIGRATYVDDAPAAAYISEMAVLSPTCRWRSAPTGAAHLRAP